MLRGSASESNQNAVVRFEELNSIIKCADIGNPFETYLAWKA